MSNPRDVIGAVLPKSWSQNKRDILADEIIDALVEKGALFWDDKIQAVEVGDARLPVETIEAYGLELQLDAMGEASTISHRSGLVIA